jgi:hypothetical protein
MQSMPYPTRGGSLTLLRNLLNIGDDDNWILCVSWLIAACRPTGPYPVLIFHGEQGSAKSTTEKLLRRIVDPSVALVRTPPRDERDLVIAGSNSWVLAYDNVSGIPGWLSDALCRVATGGGFSTRQLYTDSDEVLFEAMRPIILNGIDHLADRPDLAERAIILDLPSIGESARREESALYAEFDRRLPQIFGGLCDAVSTALALLPRVELRSKPRMADFAMFATAAMPALGFLPERFLAAYDGNQAEAVQETLEGDLVAAAIITMMDDLAEREGTEVWEGTCKALLCTLETVTDDAVKRSHVWPKMPRGLSGRLRRLVTVLRKSGIEVTFSQRGAKGRRLVTITRKPVDRTVTTVTSAFTDQICSVDQQVADEGLGDGSAAGVTVESDLGIGPPPRPVKAISLNGRGNQPRVAEVTVEAVVCSEIPNAQGGREETLYRVDLCTNCGRVDWEWVGGTWVCPGCGEPVRGQRTGDHPPDIERFEL